jgi:phage terminase large subunit
MILTKSFNIISSMGGRIRIIQGSSSASKTYSILQKIILQALESNQTKLWSIVTDTHPNVTKGAYRDFINILEDIPHTKTKVPLEVHINNWTFEFFGLDDETKARGGRRDGLFINEADRIKWETARQLIMRTREVVYIDFNPVAEFWAHTKYKGNKDTSFEIVTYKDNEACPQAAIDEIESYINSDPEWFKVYGLGIVGNLFAGKVFKNWEEIDEFPNIDYWYGLDFGFSNDPTAIIKVAKEKNSIFVDEILYQIELTNADIAKMLKNSGYNGQIVICDSAEPKSIQELKLLGINALPADKRPGSIMEGIDYLKRHSVLFTRRSSNIKTEYRHYKWKKDRDGNFINKPVDMFNHGIDALRYAFSLGLRNEVKDESLFISYG